MQVLPTGTGGDGSTAHAAWLGASVREDIEACLPLLHDWSPDWLLVDHYALDASWEAAIRSYCRRLMVIDDLADRDHMADLLLDQNLGRHGEDYAGRLPAHCRLLVGCEFALLRPEFERWRVVSLERARTLPVAHLLINLGGVDKDNLTQRVLRLLPAAPLAGDCRITVVMGRTAPWVEPVRSQAAELPWPCEVLVNVRDMARLLASADLIIGAAGSSSWERCALGLPSLLLVAADNQRQASQAMEQAGIARVVWPSPSFETDLLRHLDELLSDARSRQALSLKAAGLCDGLGAGRVIDAMHEVLP